MSTTAERTVKLLRKLGYMVERVERDCRIPKKDKVTGAVVGTMFFKKDFLGIADYIAFRRGRIMAVQVTDITSVGKHVTKICAEPLHRGWLEAGGQICVFGWPKETKTQPRLVAWINGEPTESPGLGWLCGTQNEVAVEV